MPSINNPPPYSASKAALDCAHYDIFSRILAAAVNEGRLHIGGSKDCELTSGYQHIPAWYLVEPSPSSSAVKLRSYLVGLSHHPIQRSDGSVAAIFQPDISDCIFRAVELSATRDALPAKASTKPFAIHIHREPFGSVSILNLVKCDLDPVALVAEAAAVHGANHSAMVRAQLETTSTVEHLAYAYLHAPDVPDPKNASPMDWEQSIAEGQSHWAQPWCKARCAYAPMPEITARDTERLKRPRLAFVALRWEQLEIMGEYEAYLARILRINQIPPEYRPENGWLVVPVHPTQLPSVRDKFPSAVVIEHLRIDAVAQLGLRTVEPVVQEIRTVSLPHGADIAEETLVVKVPFDDPS
ncbi:hypothetical protein BOTBODRAFT_178217 [Botryobasidium botryosum FD-172 SS1]|uniref:Aerobactin siderophore biosynthesis IucA/IucC N-terminal domain-containing protein n=1 Tax=Botryobasidium botryosum (strain FD-172 SS1) TaxID=930990 RepID=A0A067M6R3_BOTB1|nr:hypothetical protein BOTBODRAFT_178217 [Botryobasidium botryosum FD-172 SS1]